MLMFHSRVHLRRHAASMRLKTWVESRPGFLYAFMGPFYGIPGPLERVLLWSHESDRVAAR
jgi:hypothetical protein